MATATETAPTASRAKTITAPTPADLLDKIYAAEGWTRSEGEVRSRRAVERYILGRDNRRGLYTAVRKAVSQ